MPKIAAAGTNCQNRSIFLQFNKCLVSIFVHVYYDEMINEDTMQIHVLSLHCDRIFIGVGEEWMDTMFIVEDWMDVVIEVGSWLRRR